jgi:hypothetical protein
MFDGRPIYCAQAYDVKQAFETTLVSKELIKTQGINGVMLYLRGHVRSFIRSEYPEHVILDAWDGQAPINIDEADKFERMQIVKLFNRTIVAVKS